jgi:hypothetical protein
MEPIESEKHKVEYLTAEELVDFVTIKPDEDLPYERLTEIIQRINNVQDDLDFLRDWLKHHLKHGCDVNSVVASYILGEARRSWNYLQAVYRFLAKVISNAQN